MAPIRVLTALDHTRTQYYHFKAIIIAGMGLFTDSYDLFCIVSVMKILGRVYYPSPAVDGRSGMTATALCGGACTARACCCWCAAPSGAASPSAARAAACSPASASSASSSGWASGETTRCRRPSCRSSPTSARGERSSPPSSPCKGLGYWPAPVSPWSLPPRSTGSRATRPRLTLRRPPTSPGESYSWPAPSPPGSPSTGGWPCQKQPGTYAGCPNSELMHYFDHVRSISLT